MNEDVFTVAVRRTKKRSRLGMQCLHYLGSRTNYFPEYSLFIIKWGDDKKTHGDFKIVICAYALYKQLRNLHLLTFWCGGKARAEDTGKIGWSQGIEMPTSVKSLNLVLQTVENQQSSERANIQHEKVYFIRITDNNGEIINCKNPHIKRRLKEGDQNG